MGNAIFNGKGSLILENPMALSSLRDEMRRYESLPKLMNLYEKTNGFFDSQFESFWEKETGLSWREWGKL